MLSMHALPKTSFCTACFSGKYPEKIENANGKLALEKGGYRSRLDSQESARARETRSRRVTPKALS
jgi:hypothetical protein